MWPAKSSRMLFGGHSSARPLSLRRKRVVSASWARSVGMRPRLGQPSLRSDAAKLSDDLRLAVKGPARGCSIPRSNVLACQWPTRSRLSGKSGEDWTGWTTSRLTARAQFGPRMRALRRGSLARPYPALLISLTLVMWPSTGPVLHGYRKALVIASRSSVIPAARRANGFKSLGSL